MYRPRIKDASKVEKQPPDHYLSRHHLPDPDVKNDPARRGENPALPAVEPIIGTSSHADALRNMVRAASTTPRNLFLVGEPGSGKRFLARCIHQESSRPPRAAFVEVSPQTPEEELRVILFNEERRKHEGILGRALPRLARQTTLFVRNIHEFGFLAQTRVARFLIQNEQTAAQEGEAVRVVFSLPDPWEEIAGGRPMNDSLETYCRRYEQVVVLPLRHRREDIPAFVDYFLRSMTADRPPAVQKETMGELCSLPYYDNVRELRLILADGLRMSGGEMLVMPDIVRDEPAAVRALLANILRGKRSELAAAMDGLEKALIRRALLRCDLDRTRAAGLLGITEINLRYRLRKFNLQYPLPGNARPSRASRRSKPR